MKLKLLMGRYMKARQIAMEKRKRYRDIQRPIVECVLNDRKAVCNTMSCYLSFVKIQIFE